MELQIKIEHQELGVVDLVTTPSDLIDWEQETKQKWDDLFTDEGLRMGVTDLMCIAWAACIRTGLTQAPFQVFRRGILRTLSWSPLEVNPTQGEVSQD